jgi:hypothetical protein
MRFVILPLLLASVAACSAPTGQSNSTAAAVADEAYLKAQQAKLSDVAMNPDTSYLTAEEKQVVNLLIQASGLMSEIYKRQRLPEYAEMRAAIEKSALPQTATLLAMYDSNFGPWNEVDDLKPFWGGKPMPEGAGFYPADLTKAEFDAYLAKYPAEKAALSSLYTVVRRDGDKLKAVPYSIEYKEWLEPAAKLLEQAAGITTNASLKKFLTLRAKAFRTDNYFESELAWMDLKDTPIEIVIGPYEVYTDRLYGWKSAFEAYVTLRNPQASAALDKYKGYLRAMEANLPVDEKYKNFTRGFESPIAVVDQLQNGGDARPGVQSIAFNLPNDERVREAKGAKKVILANVLEAKYERILKPMAPLALVPDQAALVMGKYMQFETIFHELSHSLGPGSITVGGRKTTVNEELKEQAGPLEEAKADVMGVWNILFMMQKNELPAAEKNNLLATYFVGIFRAMRFGTESAHGQGAAMQYGYLKAKGAFAWDAGAGRYRIDYAKMEAGLRDLLADMIRLQGDGDYAGTKSFMAKWSVLDDPAKGVIKSMEPIPTDIRPSYPDKI